MKKLFVLILTVAMLFSLSVTAFAAQTATITLELTDSYGDGWETTSVKACLVKSDGSEEVLQAGMTVSGDEATYELTVNKYAVVRFYWEASEDYDFECGVTVKRNGNIQFEQVDFDGMAEGDLIFESSDYDPRFTAVTYSVAPTYTVTIPTDVTIDGNATTISAENVVVEKGKYVSVTLADDNDFTVATPEGAELSYTVTTNGENLAAGGEILAVNPTDGKIGSATVTFAIDENSIQYAGTYTGTATFTIAVKDAPKTIINFTLDMSNIETWIPGLTQNLQAEVGMTWGEWMESEYNVDGYVPDTMWGGVVVVSVPNEDWAITDGGYPNYVEYTDEIIANHTYDFSITGG